MKYVWTLVLVGLMVWTWSAANSDSSYDLQASARTESEFEQIIRDSIQQSRPNAKVRFLKLFTEMVMPERQMRAHYRYEIEEGAGNGDATVQVYSGFSTLLSDDGGQTWKVSSNDVMSPTVAFKNGSLISPEGKTPQQKSQQTQ